MDTKKYAVFAKTVELSSLTRAAEELALTQSGVSHIIAAVEEELGLTLLRRSRTGAVLTPAGEELLPYIKELLRQEELLRAAAEELQSADTGEVRIGTFTSVATHWLPAMLKEFEETCPKISFRLFNGDYHDVDRWLENGEVDIGFITLPTERRYETIPLREDPLLAVLPEHHYLAELPICPVVSLVDETFISLLQTSDHDAQRALDAAGINPKRRINTKDDYAVIAMVRQGLGVSIMPELLLRDNSQGVLTRPICPEVRRTLALALPAGEKTGPAARRFAEFAVKWVERNG